VRMSEVFPGLFTDNKDFLCGFIKDSRSGFITENDIICHPGEASFWNENAAGLLSLQEFMTPAGGRSNETVIGSRTAYVSSIHVSQLGGSYVTVIFRDVITADLSARRNAFYVIAGIAFGLLALAVNMLVRAMLRRFYRIVKTVREIKGGNLTATAPDLGNDEIGDLGKQINQMLDSILKLMDENIKRELLARNSEIRALQSQINSHFI